MSRDYGIESEIIPQIASAFGGGIGNTGAVCGAVIGAVMAIGLVRDRGDTPDDWFGIAAVAEEFRRRFEAEMKTINCRELTGADLTTPEGLQHFMSSDIPQRVCFPAVGLAYRLVTELLQETQP